MFLDDLLSELFKGGHTKSNIFARILIGFLQVLVKDLQKKNSSKKVNGHFSPLFFVVVNIHNDSCLITEYDRGGRIS